MSQYRLGGFNILPTVVKNIIIINVLMVLAQFALGRMGIDLAQYLGLHYWTSHYFKPWQLLTHIFMHGSYNDLDGTILHIFSNMFALWMFGGMLENRWGARKFLTFYLVCGIGAALCHLTVLHFEYSAIERAFYQYQQNPTLDQYMQFARQYVVTSPNSWLEPIRNLADVWSNNPGNPAMSKQSVHLLYSFIHGGYGGPERVYVDGMMDVATVGASGAVFGILFAFGYLFPNMLIYLYFFVPVKAKYFVALYALFELYSGIRNSAGDNVAHFAHLGGMLFAFIMLYIWRKQGRSHYSDR